MSRAPLEDAHRPTARTEAAPGTRRGSSRLRGRRRCCCGWRTSPHGADREGDRHGQGPGPADDLPPAQHARRRGPAGQGRAPPLHPRPQQRDPRAGVPARARPCRRTCSPRSANSRGAREETAYLADWGEHDIRVLASRGGQPPGPRGRGRRAVRTSMAHARANGKVLLAFARPELREAYLRVHPLVPADRVHDLRSRRARARSSKRIRKRGYAYDQRGVRGRRLLRRGAAAPGRAADRRPWDLRSRRSASRRGVRS